MDENLNALLAIFLIVVMSVVMGVVIGSVLSQLQCTLKAKALGYKCEWGLLQGCVLEKPNGSKVLLENLRYNDLD